ncbi:MAG: hypothetical protein ACRDQZ_09120 [Mycobacteriales bacterium]
MPEILQRPTSKSVLGKRKKAYAKLCTSCAAGREPSRREITFGRRTNAQPVFMWLHDSINQCGAAVLREENHQLDLRAKLASAG